ncbi:lpg0008 family Dot/Icm T4SS effector [Legionella cincinnatiensis]|uniref:Dot/Icm T4SS effector n=1 Tax=Legionella cincinnatiensis TaxID=28085 RepID=A0A378IEI6_9GAMM|nr:lpg0008 family Dot/Icm T4SS effector [Legionella cincinnatiensis]KTC92252.1 hypothetical protein Lcin_1031 [Legionella cincinnatiensis]STX33443.1 Uncharacterised protein [Legionella cincinnatiensis]
MPFTYEQIIELENPYEQLSNGDALAENAKVLNQLSEEEQKTLATKIIAACPQSEFKQYGRHINALRSFEEESFHAVISGAYQVRQRIFALLDPRNKTPHTLFLEEFSSDLFNNFNDLTKGLLKDNEQAIAERLALCTPERSRSKLARNIEITFPHSSFATKSKAAFAIRHNVDKLLGETPEQFFESRDFNKDAYNMFPSMFQALLKGQEEKIGKKLSTLDNQDAIRRQLTLLHTEVFDEANPFKLIAEAMGPKTEQKKVSSQSTNPSRMFGHSRRASISPKYLNETPKVSSETDDKKSEEGYEKSSFSC